MAEPSSGVVFAAVTAVVLEVLGIDVKALIWAFTGAFFLQVFHHGMTSKFKAFTQVALGGMLGAILGSGLAELFGMDAPTAALMLCAVCGAGAFPITNAAIKFITSKLETQK